MLPTSCQFNELRWKICFKIALLNATYTMARCQPLVLAPMLTWLPSKAWRSWIFTPRRLYFSYAAMHLLVKYTYVQICCCKNVNCRRMRHVAQFRELQRKNREIRGAKSAARQSVVDGVSCWRNKTARSRYNVIEEKPLGRGGSVQTINILTYADVP